MASLRLLLLLLIACGLPLGCEPNAGVEEAVCLRVFWAESGGGHPKGFTLSGGPWQGTVPGTKTAYQYNGIEHVNDFGLNVNMATYRTLDPVVGRWWSVDPKAEHDFRNSPYNSMYNSPMFHNDPAGDCPLCVAAAIGAFVNVASQSMQRNINSFGDFVGSLAIGAFSGAVGAGVASGISASLAGGSFGGGFLGTSGVSSAGFISGALSGAGGGLAGGFVSGFGNKLSNGGNIGEALKSGVSTGISGALYGGISGGISGGIKANKAGANWWNGTKRVTSEMAARGGYGALDIADITGKYVGNYDGVSIYESSVLGSGTNSSGATFPGPFGSGSIFLGDGSYSKRLSYDLFQHEFGHILQAREYGLKAYYEVIAPTSVYSYHTTNSHMSNWTETWASHLANKHFGTRISFPAAPLSLKHQILLRSYWYSSRGLITP
ncbi:hypothetical protein QWY85_19300 [Neolewinella lacunae]|uniref:RHS repeat-associated core domain-containing protein n=1 Tax=Neolewinella lacunae TaxID=1517758 RepID=A0A923T8W3_9BACT|nr:hypothetical protein [Neolewinella lacunae]MBC6996055.1 hypothetical protein [Neolewinella lacunae]MDN3636825.1 hypothetical protein [Neolewinella lacunae]